MNPASNRAPFAFVVLDRWVAAAWQRAALVAWGTAISTVAMLVYVALNLGFNLDNKQLLDPDLPFQRAAREMAVHFPSLDDALLVVVDADTPELCRSATGALAERLAAAPDLFRDVYAPAALPFFARNALLYRTTEELWQFSDRVAEMQPVLAELSREPTVASLARVVRLGLEHQQSLGEGAAQWPDVLDRIGDATVEMVHEFPVAVSWEELLVAGYGLDVVPRQVIVAGPNLQFDRLLAADAAIAHIRAAANALDLTPERGVKVRITGNPALNYDEMYDLAWDVGIGGVASFVLIMGVLFLALRSRSLVAAAVCTLLVGLVWTSAFATSAVGSLNILSITFGLLFIGLGVDFPLHLGMHFAEACRREGDPDRAIQIAAREVAPSLLLCAVTTAIGFLAFVPTDYRGVSELGLITAGGMIVIFVLTLTLFPAMARLTAADPRTQPWTAAALAPARLSMRAPVATLLAAVAAGAISLAALPQLRFDTDVIGLRNPATESVAAFRDLLADAQRSPWSVDVLATDLDAAVAVAERLEALEVVGHTITAADYVPVDQEEKRDILADAAFLLEPPPPAVVAEPVTPAAQVLALRALHAALAPEALGAGHSATLQASAARLRAELDFFLQRVADDAAPEAALQRLEKVLLGNFDEQLQRLDAALEPEVVDLDSLPPQIRDRYLAPDGSARVQVFARDELDDSESMEAFVDAVREVAPNATGVAANLVSFGRATARSMVEALALAAVAIALLLAVLQRRIDDPALILFPAAIGLLATTGAAVGLGMSFNFVNVVVLPLLLGVGVDSGIHLLRRARAGMADHSLPQTTAAAVFYSALTTMVGFGSLALSGHQGVSSMGVLLVIGMLCMLVGNLVVLPALIRIFVRERR